MAGTRAAEFKGRGVRGLRRLKEWSFFMAFQRLPIVSMHPRLSSKAQIVTFCLSMDSDIYDPAVHPGQADLTYRPVLLIPKS